MAPPTPSRRASDACSRRAGPSLRSTSRWTACFVKPATNNTFNREEADNAAFSVTPPSEQPAAFGDRFAGYLRGLGYPEAEARELAASFLPDVLTYNWLEPAGFPNGRRLTDDTADRIAALLTMGRITSDGAGPHTDLLDAFPFLGPPHLAART